MTYTYSIQNDFPLQKIDMGSFIDEVKAALIPVENLVVQSDVVKIITSLDLTFNLFDISVTCSSLKSPS